jgi:hypothetical protein
MFSTSDRERCGAPPAEVRAVKLNGRGRNAIDPPASGKHSAIAERGKTSPCSRFGKKLRGFKPIVRRPRAGRILSKQREAEPYRTDVRDGQSPHLLKVYVGVARGLSEQLPGGRWNVQIVI